MDPRNQPLKPGDKVYNENLLPGQVGQIQPMQGQQSTSSMPSGMQSGVQPGMQSGMQSGQTGYNQNLQPGQPGYMQNVQPGQQTSGQSFITRVENLLPGHGASSSTREQTATSLENQPGMPGYNQNMQQGLQPGQPGYLQNVQPGQTGMQSGMQPGMQSGMQSGQTGYNQNLQPGQPGYMQNMQPGMAGSQQPGPGYSSSQPAGQGLGQQIGQSIQHAFGSSPMPGQSTYVTGQNLPSQQNIPGQMPMQQGMGMSSSSSMPGSGGQPSYGPPSVLGFGRPTVFPTPSFNANADAEKLRNAIKGTGTDNATIIDIFGSRTSMELKQADLAYKTMFGSMMMRDIENDLKLSGGFSKIVNYRFFTLAEFDAHNVHKSVVGSRTDENALIEIFATRNNQQIRDAGEAYRRMFSKDMEKDVVGDTSGNFRNLMTSLLQAGRDESGRVDMNAAVADANLIYNSGQGRWGTDDLTLNNIFATRSFSQLALIFNEYSRVSKYDIEQSIEKEMSGNLKLAMLAIIRSARDRAAFFAERLYNAMKGLGSDERTINRIIVSRCEVDLEDIKQAFNVKYSKDLSKMIESETKGDYQRILLQLLGNFRPNVVY